MIVMILNRVKITGLLLVSVCLAYGNGRKMYSVVSGDGGKSLNVATYRGKHGDSIATAQLTGSIQQSG